jgi:fructoselysine-6-P-deglycase FrlB-like protein
MSEIARELASQPACWERAAALAARVLDDLPARGRDAVAIGCGTSWFVAQAYSSLRNVAGAGRTEASAASEFTPSDQHDVIAVSRSGTTTEVIRVLESLQGRARTTVVTADPRAPLERLADRTIALEFADERSVVQTRFATSALALLRSHLGEDISTVIREGEGALEAPLPDLAGIEHAVFLGHGWSNAIAAEAALKLKETAGLYTESHPAMEYRHGPISVAGTSTLVWILATSDPDIADDVRATGARVVVSERDPMAELVLIQRTAAAIAETRGLDPDHPRNLSRSVVLS